MNRSIATVQVDTGREYRGGQRQVVLLIRGLLAAGHPVALAAPPDAPIWNEVEEHRDLQRLTVPFHGEFSWRAAWQLRRTIRAGHWDLLHTHTAHGIGAAQFARWSVADLPLVAHRRVDFPLRRHRLARLKAGWPDHWIAVAPGVARQLRVDGIAADRISVVESALDPARLVTTRSRREVRAALGIDDQVPLVGTVGQLAAHKGHQSLLEACATLERVGVLLVGDGDRRRDLEASARALGLAARTHFLGTRHDVADLIAALDLFVFPSLSGEGSPAALKEPIALGVPVLASDLPAHRDIGLTAADLVAPGNPLALRERIGAKLADREAARSHAAALRDLAQRFTPAALVAGTLAVYRDLLRCRV